MCEADGTWHGASHTCVEMICDSLPTLPHGEALKNEGVWPQIANLSCHPGYNLIGDEVVMCSLGSWMDFK